MNDALTLDLVEHFERHSFLRSKGFYHLLLLDGYGSHCTVPFVKYCWDHWIIPFCFPPHMTHLFQPLDVILFQPYKHHHSVAVNDAMQTGCKDFNKLEFLNTLTSIGDQTFRETSIRSAFCRSGFIPLCPQVVLKKLKRYEPSGAMAQLEDGSPPLEALPLPATATRPTIPDCPSVPTIPRTVRSLKRQGKHLLSCDMEPEFCKKLVPYLKGSQEQAEARGLALEQLDITEAAMRTRSLQQQRSCARLKHGEALTVE